MSNKVDCQMSKKNENVNILKNLIIYVCIICQMKDIVLRFVGRMTNGMESRGKLIGVRRNGENFDVLMCSGYRNDGKVVSDIQMAVCKNPFTYTYGDWASCKMFVICQLLEFSDAELDKSSVISIVVRISGCSSEVLKEGTIDEILKVENLDL